MGAGAGGDVRRRIAVLPGDGIGPEVTGAALAYVPDAFEVFFVEAGARRYLSDGTLLTDDELEAIKDSDALLFGAVGDPRVADGVLEQGILLRLRRELDLYVNVRPFPELGVVIVRENTEGLYAGGGTFEVDTATEVSVNTVRGVERCARYAFKLARARDAHVTLVHKANVLTNAGRLWKDVVASVARRFAEVRADYEHVDAAAYHLITAPEKYDVILTDNMFGDILSDEAAALAGGLGKAASANLHPDERTRAARCLGLFEPVHGSAPDIAGTGGADPTAAVRAVEMMLDALKKEAVPLS